MTFIHNKKFIHKKHSFKEDASLAYLALFFSSCKPAVLKEASFVHRSNRSFIQQFIMLVLKIVQTTFLDTSATGVGRISGQASFLVADRQLYKWLCPSVGPSADPSVDPSVRGNWSQSGKISVLDTLSM